jgi:hypothetical protein
MSKLVYVIGDSHAVALHGKNNFADDGANMHQIEAQAQKNVPNGATVVFSGGHNDISNGKSPTQVATAVAALISKLKSRGCKVSYVLFPEGTKNNNQNQMAKARSEIKSKVNDIIVYDLNDEPNKLDKDGQHMQYSAYVSIQKQINSQNSETSSPVITTPRPRPRPRPRPTTPNPRPRPRPNVFPFEPVKTDEWLQRRRSFLMNLHSGIGLNLTVPGNTKIGAGDIVEVNLESPIKKLKGSKDSFYSGNFLVTKIKHVFRVSTLKHEMYLTVMKDSIEEKLPTGANDEPVPIQQGNPEQTPAAVNDKTTPAEKRENRITTHKELEPLNFSGTSSEKAKTEAENFLGKTLTVQEWNYLVRATISEASPNSQERAAVAGVILNRVRNGKFGDGVIGVLTAKNQFQAVTGTPKNRSPSKNFSKPTKRQIETTVEAIKNGISGANKNWLNFTSNNPKAYGPGTNLSFLRQVANSPGSKVIGGTVFGTVY